ncbi:MAG: spermidine/putrescine ABC transporter substrate-binding protein [Clostridia bacterium]|nr:spermidine/putrescine ABC transporter substrate-binding protein [Clostridia bacterium]
MKKILSLILVMCSLFSLFALCAHADTPEINVYNWGEYVPDGTDGFMDVNEAFTKKTGIKINYTTYQSNEEMYAKISGGGVSYDLIFPSDYMVSKMIAHDMLVPIHYENIPNYKNVRESFKNLEYDPQNKYSVPYTGGTVGIMYNKKLIKPGTDLNTWSVLWDKQYKGQILMFSNSRDAFACAFSKLGYSLNTTDEKEWLEAAEELKKQRPLVQSYAMDQIMDKMIAGEAALAPYYAGDALICMGENEDLDFIIPENAVFNRFVDAMCILKGSEHQKEAEAYINFLLEPEIGAEISMYLGYTTVNKESYKLLDKDMQNSPIAYPSEDILKNAEVFVSLPENIDKLQQELWTSIRADSSGSGWSIVYVIGAFALLWAIIAFYNRVIKRKRFK